MRWLWVEMPSILQNLNKIDIMQRDRESIILERLERRSPSRVWEPTRAPKRRRLIIANATCGRLRKAWPLLAARQIKIARPKTSREERQRTERIISGLENGI